MSQDVSRPVWNKVGKRKIGPMLIGTQLHRTWRDHTAEVTQFRFTGPLQAALRDLADAARKKKLYLPITSLRTTLALTVEDLVGVDHDFGMGRRATAAIETYRSDDAQALVLEGLSNWASQQLVNWSGRHDLVRQTIEVTKHLKDDHLLIQHAVRPYANEGGQPDFPIIVRDLAERLIGEELFDGLGPCRFVATGEGRFNTIELTTAPKSAGDRWYSMVATLSIVTVPYAQDPLLKISALKRNWTQRAPKVKSSGPGRFRAYVYPPKGPCVPVWVDRDAQDWVFSDDYAFPLMQSKGALPLSIPDAVKFAPEEKISEKKWWVGLPELPTLFSRIAPRTVFESDEKALLDRVRELVAGVAGEEIVFERHNLGRRGTSTKFSMLKMEDIAENLLIQGIVVEDDDDSLQEGEEEEAGVVGGKLPDFRKQNEQVLARLHGEAKPHLWVFGGTEREQEIVRNTVTALFGDRVECIQEVLPPGTHGLMKDLEPEGEKRRPAIRFQARAEVWRAAVGRADSRFATLDVPKYALIIAPDEYERRPEDPVNYHAGIHALSALGANVHHCLPIDDDEGGEPRFLQRVQSSLLDVLFAHSGLVLGVASFLEQLLEHRAPRYVHGVQVIRSLSRAFTGEQDVRFIAFTRLETTTGRTELQIAYPGSPTPTPWKPLAEALRWLASQTNLAGRGGEAWLELNFNQAIKRWLIETNEIDPQALVLIDWPTLAGRWKGIRDQDLRPGAVPTIDQINLATAFSKMSLVRIRRGNDTLSLRSVAEQSYEGWLEGEDRKRTGEVLVDSYLTTTKCLAELPHRGPGAGRGAHFIASMGYQQATQPRGLSCYRSVTRVVATKDDASKRTGRFEPVVRTPVNGDQAIPASLDITVLSCPADLEPSAVAKAVMGLRLGYAHYGEWTSMPAPLFFRRKVEDYIIRYVVDGQDSRAETPAISKAPEPAVSRLKPSSESEEIGAEREEIAAGIDAEPQRTSQLTGIVSKSFEAQVLRAHDKKTDTMVEVVEGISPPLSLRPFTLKNVERPVTESALDTLRLSTAPLTPALAALRELEEISVPALYHEQKRLYWMLLRGDAKVRVDLPAFATERALFSRHQYVPNKRDLKWWWQTLQKHSIVKPREPMVDGNRFWNWHFQKLKTPQTIWFLNSILPMAINHLAEPIQNIKRRYQANISEIGERMPPDHELMERVLEWAVQKGSDEDLAWLIFDLAHRPTLVKHKDLLGYVRKVPGPLTKEAIGYMARVGSALSEAIDLLNRKALRIDISRSNPNPVAPRGLAAAMGSSTHVHESGDSSLVIASAADAESLLEKIMQLKSDLISQITALVPGSIGFDAGLQKASETLRELGELHRQLLDLAVRAREEAQRIADEAVQAAAQLAHLNGQAKQMAIDLAGHPLCHDVPEMHLDTVIHEPLTVFDPAVSVALAKAAAAMATAEIAHTAYGQATTRASAPRQSSTERRAAVLAQVTALEQLEIASAGLRDAVLGAEPILHLAGLPAPLPQVSQLDKVVAELVMEAPAPAPAPRVVASDEPVLYMPQVAAAQMVITPAVGDEILFPKVPVVAAVEEEEEEAGASADLAQADGDAARSLGSEEEAKDAMEVLQVLCSKRRYELAALQVDAIVEARLVADLLPHEQILKALFETLNALDCRFSVNSGVDPSLVSAIEAGAQADKLGALVGPVATAVGVLSASLPYLLFGDLQSADRSTILGFVQPRLKEIESLAALVQSLWDQSHKNIILTREKLAMTGLDAKAAVDREIRRFRERAGNWLHDPMITSSIWNKGSKAINMEIYRASSPIGALLAAIARGDDRQAEKLYEEARRRLDKPTLALTEGMRSAKERAAPDGMYRQRMIENVEVTAKFVQDYFGLLARSSGRGSALSKTERAWIESVFQQLRDSSVALANHDGKSLVEQIYFGAARTTLTAALRLFSDETPALCVEALDQRLLLKLPLGIDFIPSYKGPDALCGPDEVLTETKRLSEEALDLTVPKEDESSLHSALLDAAQSHLSNNRFRPAYALRDRINVPGFSSELLNRHRKVRIDLRTDLDQAGKRVVHALSLSSINQAEANHMQRDLSEIDKVLRAEPPVGDPSCEYQVLPDVPHVLAALRLRVTSQLDRRLADTRFKLELELRQYEAEHAEHAGDIRRIKAMLERENATDIRAAYDALSSLRTHGQALPSQDKNREYVGVRYDRFISEVTKGGGRLFLDALQHLLGQAPVESDLAQLQELDADGRVDALRILSLWTELTKNQPQRIVSDYENLLEEFFKLIGARIPPLFTFASVQEKRRVEFHWSEPPFVMPATGLPPELGSLGLNIRGFLIRGGDSEVEIQQAVTQSSGPTLVLARGRFSLDKRAKLCNRHPVLLLDDYLIGWIAVSTTGRLAAMLEIALLTFTASPYADFGGQPVPPEMFYGRETELRQLRAVQQAAVLYGGRRLGKSSLLDQIQRDYARDINYAKAVYLSVDAPETTGSDHVSWAWRELLKKLVTQRVVKQFTMPKAQAKDIAAYIESQLQAADSPIRDLFLLIDEADQLMEYELGLPENAPSFVRMLQKMCESLVGSKVRVRYVLAGLHNVARMTTEVNSPLGKADSIALEPFSTPLDIRNGMELITQPMEALGFRFDHDDLPWRIMSVCNFYPAFIQLYCKNLLECMYNKRQNKPQTMITAQDLDSVEKDDKLLGMLQEKFALNLNLDKRYKAIALILADRYYTGDDSQQGLTAVEAREFCELMAGPHFTTTGPGAYEALLDEMKKLNMLERVGSRYVLRNPNIAMMMGDKAKVIHDLDELSREKVVRSRSTGERRVTIQRANQSVLFPMPAAWVRTKLEYVDTDSQLLILVGNKLSGLNEIAMDRGEEWSLCGDDYHYSHNPFRSIQDIEKHIRKLPDTHKHRLLAVSASTWKITQLDELVTVAQKAAKRGVRIVLITSPLRVREMLPKIHELQLDPRWSIESVPSWTDDAVFYHIRENVEISDNNELMQSILRSTAGFGLMVERLTHERSAKALPTACQRMERDLTADLAQFHQEVGLTAIVENPGTLRQIADFARMLHGNARAATEDLQLCLETTEAPAFTPTLLQWMGLLLRGSDGTWKVPALYLQAIERKA